MAEIKCRYFIPKCEGYLCDGKRDMVYDNPIYHQYYDGGYCSSDDVCEGYMPSNKNVFFSRCARYYVEQSEFEKTYKSYEFNDCDGLKIGKKNIPAEHIEYLEINGRVLIQDDAEVEDGKIH